MPNLLTNHYCEAVGLKELDAKLKAMQSAVAGAEAQSVLAEVAVEGASMFRAKATEMRWPHEAVASIFSYGKTNPNDPEGNRSALFGLRKRGRSKPYAPGYVEWGKRTGKVIGESLGAMFEHGTSKMPPKPALRPTITRFRGAAAGKIAAGYKTILDKFTA